jgi:DNA-binding NtrC family response regulator
MTDEAAVYPFYPILIVDDEPYALQGYELLLLAEGMGNVMTCRGGREALDELSQGRFAAVALDLLMPGMNGEEVLAVLSQDHPDVPTIVVTGANDAETAVRCMKGGAFDYIVKPVEPTRFITTLKRALAFGELRRENDRLKQHVLDQTLRHPEFFDPIVTGNERMLSIFRYAESIAGTTQPVLITGETGVGKEMIAKALHQLSRYPGDFVSVNVAGLDDSLFADTLFGHKRGAFTGADRDRGGLVEKAAGGTLFLDEIGDLSKNSQVKLLRLLQERDYYPIGSDVTKSTDARVIVATNQDLGSLQASGQFRKDLYYRLRLHQIHLPPLRERREDIPLLVDFFIREAAREMGKTEPAPLEELFSLLNAYSFPGNVRELRALVYDAVARHSGGQFSLDSFREAARCFAVPEGPEGPPISPPSSHPFASMASLPTLEEGESLLIDEALRRTRGNRTLAAELLNTTRQTLHRRLAARRRPLRDPAPP